MGYVLLIHQIVICTIRFPEKLSDQLYIARVLFLGKRNLQKQQSSQEKILELSLLLKSFFMESGVTKEKNTKIISSIQFVGRSTECSDETIDVKMKDT